MSLKLIDIFTEFECYTVNNNFHRSNMLQYQFCFSNKDYPIEILTFFFFFYHVWEIPRIVNILRLFEMTLYITYSTLSNITN